MVEDLFSNTADRMNKALEILKRDLAGIRTGRASPGLVENLRVDYHGVPTPLNQLASISVPEARLLVIQPWDPSSMGDIEKAILKSDLGVNPSNDGRVIRLSIPQLTEERRKDLIRVVRKKIEDGRVAVRNIRRDTLETLRQQEREKDISEDDRKRSQDRLQQITDEFIAKADQIGQEKEAEVMEV
jgi:ribosome recycling factor